MPYATMKSEFLSAIERQRRRARGELKTQLCRLSERRPAKGFWHFCQKSGFLGRARKKGRGLKAASLLSSNWSGRGDLNPRPPEPHSVRVFFHHRPPASRSGVPPVFQPFS